MKEGKITMNISIEKSFEINTIEAFAGTCSSCPYTSDCGRQNVNGAQNSTGTPQTSSSK